MSAERLLREGRVREALEALQAEVRRDPSNSKHRIFLFQLLAVRGEWDRALTQLTVAGEMDSGALAMMHAYQQALRCEALRTRIFAGEKSPVVFGQPPGWVALLLEALKLAAAGSYSESQDLRQQAFDAAQAVSGAVNGRAFEWIADADPRIGPVFEAIINGNYYWVPMEHVRQLKVEEPADLRDMVWMPAYFTWTNGGEAAGLIPTRYPGSETSDDDMIVLARKTEWIEREAGIFQGLGQRMLATDGAEFPLMEVRLIDLQPPDED